MLRKLIPPVITALVAMCAIAFGGGTVITAPSQLTNNSVTDAKLRDSAALSVIGRAANSIGDPGDIVAGSDGQVLRRSGTALGFGSVATAGIADNAITYAKLQDVSSTSRFVGRITSGAGDAEELTGTQATSLLDTFTSGAKGLAPASGGGATNFLRADGVWTAPAVTYSGWGVSLGPGPDGSATMDGSSVVAGMTPSGGVYTATRDLYFTSLTVDVGVRLDMDGYWLHVDGACVVNGRIHNDGDAGGNGSAAAAGTGGAGGGGAGTRLGTGSAGGNGSRSASGTGGTSLGGVLPPPFSSSNGTSNGGGANSDGGAAQVRSKGGGGGGGGAALNASAGTTGGSVTVASSNNVGPNLPGLLMGFLGVSTRYNGGTGGGGGGAVTSQTDAAGGGGGGGGGVLVVQVGTLTGSGAISANGGAGGNGYTGGGSNFGGGGGGGGGGVCVVLYNTRSGVSITASGGAGGAKSGGTAGNGAAGADGYAFRFNRSGDGT